MFFPPLKVNMEQELKCRNIPTILSDLSFIQYWLISKNVGIFLQSERSVLNWTELNSSKLGTDVNLNMLFPPLKANMEQELPVKCRNIPTFLSDLSFIKYWLISKNERIFLQSERSVLNWTELNASKYGNRRSL